MKLVEIDKLNYKYSNTDILSGISLSIRENERILLVGKNGAGKSTLLRIIAGMHIVRDYNKFDILGNNIPQDQCNGLAYLGNKWERSISFGGTTPYIADIKVKNMLKHWQEEYIDRRNELVDILNIDLNWSMHTVSDGQRKRIQIMLALLKPFRLLIIDEFLNELDVITRDRFFRYIDDECNKRNCGIIYATHIFDSLHKWINKVIYISDGKCEDKINLKKFIKNQENLYESVKDKMLKDLKKNNEITIANLNASKGYSSGRGKLNN